MYSQNNEIYGTIVYDWSRTTPYIDNIETSLFFSSQNSYFEWKFRNLKKRDLTDNTIEHYSNSNRNLNHFIFTESKNNNIFLNLYVDNERYLVKNDEIKLEWILLDEYKTIDKYKCQKAKTTYKNRIIIAWFTNQIPLQYGPHIWHGLPGLILELYDTEKKNYFIVKAITIKKEDIISDKLSNINFNDYITIRQYEEIVNNNIDDLEKKINSRRASGKAPIKFKEECEECN